MTIGALYTSDMKANKRFSSRLKSWPMLFKIKINKQAVKMHIIFFPKFRIFSLLSVFNVTDFSVYLLHLYLSVSSRINLWKNMKFLILVLNDYSKFIFFNAEIFSIYLFSTQLESTYDFGVSVYSYLPSACIFNCPPLQILTHKWNLCISSTTRISYFWNLHFFKYTIVSNINEKKKDSRF